MTRTPKQRSRASHRRCGDDAGAALVEFAFVSILLLLLVFGIINFGLILSFKQDMTRAAAEGARAGAVALPSAVYGSNDTRLLAAQEGTDEAVAGFDRNCHEDDGLSCLVAVHDCADPVPDTNGYHESDPTADAPDGSPNTQQDCVTVELVYDYDAYPLLVPMPLISALLPDQINARSVARLNQ